MEESPEFWRGFGEPGGASPGFGAEGFRRGTWNVGMLSQCGNQTPIFTPKHLVPPQPSTAEEVWVEAGTPEGQRLDVELLFG